MEENKYKDILEGIVEIIRNAEHSDIGFASICTYMGDHCPELIMNKDEKIRKSLLNEFIHLQSKGYKFADLESKDIITWLENQGKQKPPVIDFKANNWYVSKVDGKIYDMTYNPTDNIEPKFKVGDWVTDGVAKCQIYSIDDNQYWYSENCILGSIESVNKQYHLWTIQDAKDGDVLQLGKVTAIFQKYIGSGNCKCYCSVYDGEFEIPSIDSCYGCHNAVPATNEQCDLLFKKMAEKGYAWDSEKKEMKSLISNGSDFEPELSHQEVTKKSEQGNMSKMCPRCVQEQKPQGSSIIEIINQGNAKVAADMVESKYKEFTHKEVTKKSDKGWNAEDEDVCRLIKDKFVKSVIVSSEENARVLDWFESVKERLQ